MPPENAVADEAFELRRQAYSETEAWKVAQLAATLTACEQASNPLVDFGPEDCRRQVANARALLAESRRQVAAKPVVS